MRGGGRLSWVPWAVFLAACIGFLGCLRNEFVWDDYLLITNTFGFRSLEPRHLRWMFTTTMAANFTPLAWVSYAFDYALWGLDPVGYHLTNVLLHAANAVLFYGLAARLLKAALPSQDGLAIKTGAAFASLAFALHPLRVESVVWASERRDLLAGLFFLATLSFYLRAAAERPAGKPRLGFLFASTASFVLAALSKPTVVPLPLVLLILDHFPLRRPGSKLLLLAEKAPFALVAGASSFMTIQAQLSFAGLTPISAFHVSDRIAQAVYGFGFYLGKTLFPSGLLALYPIPEHLSLRDPGVIANGVLVAALAVLSVAGLGRRAAAALWAFYAALLLPVIGILQNGPQLVALRYSYLSCMGWHLAAGAAIIKALPLWRRGQFLSRWPLAGTALGLWLIAMTALTQREISVWENDATVWRPVALAYPDSLFVNWNMADALLQRRDYAAAGPYVDKVTALSPNKNDPAIWTLQANQLIGQGRYPQARALLERAIKVYDGPEAYALLGALAIKLDKYDEGIERYRQAAARAPHLSKIQAQVGRLLAYKSRFAEAIPYYEKALALERTNAGFRAELDEARRRAAALPEKR